MVFIGNWYYDKSGAGMMIEGRFEKYILIAEGLKTRPPECISIMIFRASASPRFRD
jgi:hypothetical protein